MFSLSQAGKGAGPGPTLGRAPSCPHPLPDQGPLTMDKGEEDDEEEAWLQLRPVEPLPSQCCGSGCSPCVFDLYQRDLASWEAARASKDRSLLSGEETQVRGSRSSDMRARWQRPPGLSPVQCTCSGKHPLTLYSREKRVGLMEAD